jgi:vancomycin resistance protein YoaR
MLWRPSTSGVRPPLNKHPISRRGETGAVGLWILVAVGTIIAVCVLAILIDSAIYYNKVHAGVSVEGIDLGGKSQDEAIASINEMVDQTRSNPITLTAGTRTWDLMPDDAGTSMDVAGAVKAAMAVSRAQGFFSDIGTRFKLYFNKRDLPLDGSVDRTKLDAYLGDVAKELDIAPVNAGLAIEGSTIRVIEGVNGRIVDRATLADKLAELLLTRHSTTVEIPLVVKEPDVKAEDNREAQIQAETMIGSPIVLTYGDKKWSISPDQIAEYMGFRSEMRNGVSTLVPFMATEKMQPFLATIAPEVVKEPKDASFKLENGKPQVVPGEDGEQLDPEATADAITEISLRPTDRTLSVALMLKEPDFTTAEAESWGIKDKLSSYNTKYTGVPNRRVNVRITTQYATNVFLAPGEEYNFDKQIGPRTAARGYMLAPGITGPNTLEDVLGGGICQVSTTMFNTVILAGLQVTERHNHSIYIDHYPKGRDATVTGGGKNLRFKNNTDHYIWIVGSSTGTSTTISIYGTYDGRKSQITVGNFYNVRGASTVTVTDPKLLTGKTVVVDKGQTGKALKTHYVVTRNGEVLIDKIFTSVWPMYPKTIAYGTMTTVTTAPPTTTTTAGGG